MVATFDWRRPLAAGVVVLGFGVLSSPVLAEAEHETEAAAADTIATHVLPSRREASPVQSPPSGALAADAYRIGPGDRLRIRFDQRDELSGEYRVRTDGSITLPLIGRIDVVGRSPLDLERHVTERFFEITRRNTFAMVDVIERRPFFVSGDVNQPGTFPYVPKMTVVHAVAIAGGLYRLPQSSEQMMNVAREHWRLRSAKAEAAVHLAKRERIKALLNRHETLTFPGLIEELVGDVQAQSIQLTQRRLFEQARKWRNDQKDYLKTAVRLAEEEVKALQSRLASIKDVMKVHGKELSTTQDLLKRGLTQRQRVYRKQYDISNLLTAAANVEAEIKRAEMKRVEAIKSLTDFWPDEDRKLADELAEVEAQFETAMRNVEASSSLIGQAMGPNAHQLGINGSQVEYRILRRKDGKIQEVSVNENDRVLPGDVLKVMMLPGEGGQPSRATASSEAERPVEANIPVMLLRSAEVRDRKSRAELRRHIGELKKLLTEQSSILSNVAKSQVDLAREVEAWRARYLEVLESREKRDDEVDASRVRTIASKDEVSETTVSGGAVGDDAQPRETGPDAKTKAGGIEVVLPEKGPVSRLNSRKLAMVLQSELLRVGCYTGAVDGDWGPMSQSALRDYSKETAKRLPTAAPTLKAFAAIKDHRGAVCARREIATRLPVEFPTTDR